MRSIFLMVLTIFSLETSVAQNYKDSLDYVLNQIALKSDLPGFGVSIVNKNGLLYHNNFGFANLRDQKPYQSNTIQYIGSISKGFVAMALMKVLEEKLLSLETHINDLLPFKIIHPYFPNDPITIKHLVTHTSGLSDSKHYGKTYIQEENLAINKGQVSKHYFHRAMRQRSNLAIPMEDFLKKIYDRNGVWFSKKNFLKNKPGEHYSYANNNASLVALLIEIVSGQSFADYCRSNILEPLNLSNSSWDMSKINLDNYATPYWYDQTPFPRYSMVTYPDGGLLSTVNDLSAFTIELLKGYHGESKLLRKDSYRTMLDPLFNGGDQPGVFWDNTDSGWRGHGGGDPGTFTLLLFNTEKEIGKIFFTNTFADFDEGLKEDFRAVWEQLSKYQDLLSNN